MAAGGFPKIQRSKWTLEMITGGPQAQSEISPSHRVINIPSLTIFNHSDSVTKKNSLFSPTNTFLTFASFPLQQRRRKLQTQNFVFNTYFYCSYFPYFLFLYLAMATYGKLSHLLIYDGGIFFLIICPFYRGTG